MPLEPWLLGSCEDISLVRPKARKVLMLTRETEQLEKRLCLRVFFFLFYLASGQTSVRNFRSLFSSKNEVKPNSTRHLPGPRHCARGL